MVIHKALTPRNRWLQQPDVISGDAQIRHESTDLKEDSESSFGVLGEDRLQQLCEKFANVVFTPYETDEVEIDLYLQGLFKDDTGAKALARLRKSIRLQDDLLSDRTPFSPEVLRWCANGLLHNTLLTSEKTAVLQDFLDNDTVMREIADVLNMRWVDFKNWSWNAGEEGIPVKPRQQLNGKIRIHVDEDILQSLFLHYVRTQWSVSFKTMCFECV